MSKQVARYDGRSKIEALVSSPGLLPLKPCQPNWANLAQRCFQIWLDRLKKLYHQSCFKAVFLLSDIPVGLVIPASKWGILWGSSRLARHSTQKPANAYARVIGQAPSMHKEASIRTPPKDRPGLGLLTLSRMGGEVVMNCVEGWLMDMAIVSARDLHGTTPLCQPPLELVNHARNMRLCAWGTGQERGLNTCTE